MITAANKIHLDQEMHAFANLKTRDYGTVDNALSKRVSDSLENRCFASRVRWYGTE